MAQRTLVVIEDDIDKSPAAETVTFGLDGVSYEIDLSESNAAKLRDALAPWVAHGRRSGGRKVSRRGSGGGGKRPDLGLVRDWARSSGFKVSDRGRISVEVQGAYDAAHA